MGEGSGWDLRVCTAPAPAASGNLAKHQRTIKHKIATPADWKPGEKVIIVPKVTNDEAKKIYPDGWETIKPYLRKVPDPHK